MCWHDDILDQASWNHNDIYLSFDLVHYKSIVLEFEIIFKNDWKESVRIKCMAIWKNEGEQMENVYRMYTVYWVIFLSLVLKL